MNSDVISDAIYHHLLSLVNMFIKISTGKSGNEFWRYFTAAFFY